MQPGSHEITDVSSGNETDTADEKDVDVNPLPEPLSSLFDIRRISKLRYDNYVKIYGPCHYTNLLNIIKLQSSNTVWKVHTEGRITASAAKQSFNADTSNPCKSFIKSIMKHYNDFTTPATKYGW